MSMKCSCEAARSVRVDAAHFVTNSAGFIPGRIVRHPTLPPRTPHPATSPYAPGPQREGTCTTQQEPGPQPPAPRPATQDQRPQHTRKTPPKTPPTTPRPESAEVSCGVLKTPKKSRHSRGNQSALSRPPQVTPSHHARNPSPNSPSQNPNSEIQNRPSAPLSQTWERGRG